MFVVNRINSIILPFVLICVIKERQGERRIVFKNLTLALLMYKVWCQYRKRDVFLCFYSISICHRYSLTFSLKKSKLFTINLFEIIEIFNLFEINSFLSLLKYSFDNSDYQRNGDYFPTRLSVQKDGINLVCLTKIRSNPENNVGLMTYAE